MGTRRHNGRATLAAPAAAAAAPPVHSPSPRRRGRPPNASTPADGWTRDHRAAAERAPANSSGGAPSGVGQRNGSGRQRGPPEGRGGGGAGECKPAVCRPPHRCGRWRCQRARVGLPSVARRGEGGGGVGGAGARPHVAAPSSGAIVVRHRRPPLSRSNRSRHHGGTAMVSPGTAPPSRRKLLMRLPRSVRCGGSGAVDDDGRAPGWRPPGRRGATW